MKAVVLEISKNEATVMTHDGDIIGIRNKNYDIGQEISIKRASAALSAKIYKFTPIIAAAVAVVVVTAGGAGLYFNPYGTVSLDINPSIEYTINRFDYVLSAEAAAEESAGDVPEESAINAEEEPVGDDVPAESSEDADGED